MSQATLGRNGEVTLPADVRRALGVGPGDSVRFAVSETGDVILTSVRTLARAMRPGTPPDRPTPHGARAPIDAIADDPSAEKGHAARGVDALRRGLDGLGDPARRPGDRDD